MLSNEPFFESLRDLLTHLERIGKLQRVATPVDKDWEIACITRQVMYQPSERRYAVLFENVSGFDTAVATNTLGASRELYATALGIASRNGQIDKEAIHAKWVQALAAPLQPVAVKSGPCKENIMRGEGMICSNSRSRPDARRDRAPSSAGAVVRRIRRRASRTSASIAA
jgi:UbiD family decarboxylase